MPKKQTLTVAELKTLLIARFNADDREQMKFNARLQQELGNEVQEETPEVAAIKSKIADRISDVAAHRLKQNRRTTPLISGQDFTPLIPLMIDEIAKGEGDEFGAMERKILETFLKAMFENIAEMTHATVPPDTNPYDESWRWVTTVLGLADERGIPPAELLTSEEAVDEITRRMFTKEQLVASFKRSTNKFVNVDAAKKIILRPMLDAMATETSEKERRELERELETTIMPQVRENARKARAIINTLLNEKVKRIYGAA